MSEEIRCARVPSARKDRLRTAGAAAGGFAWGWERRKGTRVRMLTIVMPVASSVFGSRVHTLPVYQAGKESAPYLNAYPWNGCEDAPTLAKPICCNPDGRGGYEWYGYLRQGMLVPSEPIKLSEVSK